MKSPSVNEEEDYDPLNSVTSFNDFIQENVDFQTVVSGSLNIAAQSTIGGIVLEPNVGGNVNETNDAPLVGTCEEENVYADSLIFNYDVEDITEMFNNAELCAGFGSFGVPENIPDCDMFDDFTDLFFFLIFFCLFFFPSVLYNTRFISCNQCQGFFYTFSSLHDSSNSRHL